MPGTHRRARPASIARSLGALAGAVGVLVATIAMLTALEKGGSDGAETGRTRSSSPTGSVLPSATRSPTPTTGPPVRYRVAETRFAFVDASRSAGSDDRRSLPTIVWYPEANPSPPSGGPMRFPLVVFAHGFDVDPSAYAHLLHAWARAGYVVAAPVFPRTNPHALGGLDEADIVNQPADVSFVITRLVKRSHSPSSSLHGLIDPARIAVAGHSDGGETAMAVAYDSCCRDRRVNAAIVMAGAQLAVPGGRYLRAKGPPLLAIQGTGDTINPPSKTNLLFAGAPAPKYLLQLDGADHLEPFTVPGRFEDVVRRVTIEFLDRYLSGLGPAPIRLPRGVRSSGIATLRIEA